MSTFSYLGAFATFAAYQRLHGSQEAANLYQELYHPSSSSSSSSFQSLNLPLLFHLLRYIFSTTLALALGGQIVGVHGHIQPVHSEQGSRLPETISMLWLIAMCVIAMFGLDGNLGLGVFGRAWGDMVDWVHEQGKEGEGE